MKQKFVVSHINWWIEVINQSFYITDSMNQIKGNKDIQNYDSNDVICNTIDETTREIKIFF